jgi:hypothetical protein
MTEVYGVVEDYPDYEVSTFGNVCNNKTNSLLKGSRFEGYVLVTLTNESGKKNLRVHRLVAMAFIENPFDKPEVDHIDNNILGN